MNLEKEIVSRHQTDPSWLEEALQVWANWLRPQTDPVDTFFSTSHKYVGFFFALWPVLVDLFATLNFMLDCSSCANDPITPVSTTHTRNLVGVSLHWRFSRYIHCPTVSCLFLCLLYLILVIFYLFFYFLFVWGPGLDWVFLLCRDVPIFECFSLQTGWLNEVINVLKISSLSWCKWS